MSRPVQVVLLTRPGCHLCDEMKAVLDRAMRGLSLEVREVDVSKEPSLEERYGRDIPVLLIDGEKAFQHRVTERELHERLEAANAR